jgi:invasion protein IalB
MKKGEQAVIRVAAPNQQVVGLPLSLKGFTKAIGALK